MIHLPSRDFLHDSVIFMIFRLCFIFMWVLSLFINFPMIFTHDSCVYIQYISDTPAQKNPSLLYFHMDVSPQKVSLHVIFTHFIYFHVWLPSKGSFIYTRVACDFIYRIISNTFFLSFKKNNFLHMIPCGSHVFTCSVCTILHVVMHLYVLHTDSVCVCSMKFP